MSSLWLVVTTVPFSIQKSKETKIGTIRISQSYFSTLLWPGTVRAAQPSWMWGQSWVALLLKVLLPHREERKVWKWSRVRLIWLFVMAYPCGLEIPFLTCLKVVLVWIWEKCSEKSGSWAVCGRMCMWSFVHSFLWFLHCLKCHRDGKEFLLILRGVVKVWKTSLKRGNIVG